MSSYYDGDGDDDYVELPMTVTDVPGSTMSESLRPFCRSFGRPASGDNHCAPLRRPDVYPRRPLADGARPPWPPKTRPPRTRYWNGSSGIRAWPACARWLAKL